jgi:hypothetical protein
MKIIRTILAAAVIGLSVVAIAAAPAGAVEKAKVQKCDKAGKVCTTGVDCKPANCKGGKGK